MKWFALILTVVFAAVIAAVVVMERNAERPPEQPEAEENMPMILEEMVEQTHLQMTNVTTTLSWLVIGFAVFMQAVAWIAAVQKLGAVKKSGMGMEERFLQLDAIEIYFDLPLYFGLFGTVLSFILITLYPEAGLMFAYVSTALGILMAVILRLFFLTPYRQDLISRRKSVTGIS